MKQLQQLFAPVVLTLLLSASASAGIIWTGELPPPPPPANARAQSAGIMGTDAPSADPVTGAVLTVLQSVLTLL